MMKRRGWFGLIVMIALAAPARGQETGYTLDSLSRMSASELEQIYRNATPGQAPAGFMQGRVVFREDAALAGPRGQVVNWLWQGKHFSDDSLINQFRGPRMIRANVFPGESWLDGKPALILDYHHTSLLWRDVRDEVRQVSPGVYVGAMYLRRPHCPHLKLFFVLESSCACR